MQFLQQLRILLSPKDKRMFLLVTAVMFLAAMMELAGIGVLLPVAAVFLKPEWLEHEIVRQFSAVTGIDGKQHLLLAGIMLLIFVFTMKAVFSLLVTRMQAKIIFGKQRDLASRLYRNYLEMPYSAGCCRTVSEWDAMLRMVEQLCTFILMPALTVLADFLVVVVLAGVLFFLMPWTTLAGGGFMLLIGGIIFFSMKKLNAVQGHKLMESGARLSKIRLGGLNNYKYMKVGGSPRAFTERFYQEYGIRTQAEWRIFFFGQVPRMLLEWSAMLLVLAIFGIMVWKNMSPADILLQFSLLVAVFARMLPSFSRIHYGLAQIRQHYVVFDALFHDLTALPKEAPDQEASPATLNKSLELRNVSFRYAEDGEYVIRDLSVKIHAKESVAIVGRTGSGKSTLADLVMGLRMPDSGDVLADGRSVYKTLQSWRGLIGYVPQAIYFSEDTVRGNVAFGVPQDEIDDLRVWNALEMAQLLEDVEDMPGGLDAFTGENGSRLSGGQRQRLAIARALYRQPELLILDEATSALDTATEEAFVKALESLQGKITMLVIAHRLSTVENCDRVIRLDA
ncbi:MAG: ABC transporter ATP-binding protein [Lentisphaeria bacterium]|nr:ABC transporter ATP-binding protein [Lentisphaeria bacterium]